MGAQTVPRTVSRSASQRTALPPAATSARPQRRVGGGGSIPKLFSVQKQFLRLLAPSKHRVLLFSYNKLTPFQLISVTLSRYDL